MVVAAGRILPAVGSPGEGIPVVDIPAVAEEPFLAVVDIPAVAFRTAVGNPGAEEVDSLGEASLAVAAGQAAVRAGGSLAGMRDRLEVAA